MPYSSAAKTKLKLIVFAKGVNLNLIQVALLLSPSLSSGIAFSKSISPGQLKEPEDKIPDSGPSASEASPVVKIIPSVNGKETPSPEK
ncbi:MAG: Uncharacterised protein [Formosa sp. Hel3_A1_48]|nr:MAG: Uncharacterised protein [Formosa sp. Hel3_A1_48]